MPDSPEPHAGSALLQDSPQTHAEPTTMPDSPQAHAEPVLTQNSLQTHTGPPVVPDSPQTQEYKTMLAGVNVRKDGNGSLRRQRESRNYKPIPMKFPVLITFALLLAVCIGLIEAVLHSSSSPKASQTAVKRAPLLGPPGVVQKRQTDAASRPPEAPCQDFPAASSAVSSLALLVESACQQLTTEFPTNTRLDSAQVTAFLEWSSQYDILAQSSGDADRSSWQASTNCLGGSIYSYDGIHTAPATLTSVACTSLMIDWPCVVYGSIFLTDGTLTSTVVSACGMTRASMLTLTSNDPPSATANAEVLTQVSDASTLPAPETRESVITITTEEAPAPTTSADIVPNQSVASVAQEPATQAAQSSTVTAQTARVSPVLTPTAHVTPVTVQVVQVSHVTTQIVEVSTLTTQSVQVSAVTTRSEPDTTVIVFTSQTENVVLTTSATHVTDYTRTVATFTRTSLATVKQGTSTTTSKAPMATLSSSEKALDKSVDKSSYFAAIYLPPLIAIIIKVMWEIIFSSFKMMEPFQRLCKAGGTSAKRSLLAQYLSNDISLDAVKACLDGYWLSLATTIVYLCVSVLTTLAAASMTIRARDTCEVAPGQTMRCDPVWVVNIAIIRTVEALLIVSIVSMLVVLILMLHYRSGVSSNPSSIVTVATLANQEELLQDFRALDPLAGGSQTAKALEHRKCQLHYYENASGEIHYGIGRVLMPNHYMTQQYHQASTNSFRKWFQGYTAVSNPASLPGTPQKQGIFSRNMRLRMIDCLQLLSSAGLLGVVTAYRFDFGQDAFNNFFNSGTWYAEFVFVGIASIVDMQWKRLEREVRITEPYRRMARGFERPETTVLMRLNGTCWSTLPGTIQKLFKFRRMWFQTLISVMAVLSDFNIMAVVGVIWSDAQLEPTFYASAIIAMTITSLMIVVTLVTMFWWRRGVVSSIPRTPETIGNILSYLCASRFTHELSSAQIEDLSQKERDDMLIASGWRFSFRWQAGTDGRERWTVDFEPPSNQPRN